MKDNDYACWSQPNGLLMISCNMLKRHQRGVNRMRYCHAVTPAAAKIVLMPS